MLEAMKRLLPAAAQALKCENGTFGSLAFGVRPDTFEFGVDEWRLIGELQAEFDNGFHLGGRGMQLAACFVELLDGFLNGLLDVAARAELLAYGLALALLVGRVDVVSVAAHQSCNLRGYDWIDLALEVRCHPLDLFRHSIEGRQFAEQCADFDVFDLLDRCFRIVAGRHEMMSEHIVFLAMAVHTAVALFEAIRIPRDLVVHDPVAIILKIDAFRGGIGCQEDANFGLFRRRLEGGFDLLALLDVHTAVDRFQATVTSKALAGQQALKILLGRSVFGENDDALVVPAPVGLDGRFDPVEQLFRLGIQLPRRFVRPILELA